MNTTVAMIIFILSIIISAGIYKAVTENSFGTYHAYFKTAVIIWIIVFMVLCWIANSIGIG